MSHSNFGGAVVPAMAGLLFWKRAKVQEIRENDKHTLPAVIKSENQGLTGVAKYLATVPVMTSVAKYMKKQEQHQVSGVEKYLLRQAIAGKNTSGPTSVSKYISKVEKESQKQKKSSVEKYLINKDIASKQFSTLTGVAKYEAEQNLIERRKAAAEMVKRYKDQEAASALAVKEASETAAIETSKMHYQNMADTENMATTGVGRYQQLLDAKAKNTLRSTGVAKYIAKKIIEDSQKPALSTVAKYLREQSVVEAKKPVLTGVAKYLYKLPKSKKTSKERNQINVASGVAKYLSALDLHESTKPVVSGVAKYLEKQSQLEDNKTRLLGQVAEESNRAIEGEFISAQDFTATETGVSKYLQRQNVALQSTVSTVDPVLTGVAKYLNKQSPVTSLAPESKPTGVDRYLLSKAQTINIT